MKTIVLFGAGKSATSLIEYLGKCSDENAWKFIVCDSDLAVVESKIHHLKNAFPLAINVCDADKRQALIREADIVISMLPASLHFLVAKDCVVLGKNLLTASYIDDDIRTLKKEIENKKLLFIGEMGLDPGIDHMSAMKLINQKKQQGAKIYSFKSHCGGLISPESDDNPWHYKITWNPANVVAAGSAGASYLKDNQITKVPYEKIFSEKENIVNIPGLGPLAWYANRDSLSYIDTYDLGKINTFIRTTLRYPSFIKGWNNLVNSGFTDRNDFEFIKNCKTFFDWYRLKTAQGTSFKHELNEQEYFTKQVDYLGMRSKQAIPFKIINSAEILQYLLEKSLVMKESDKDMVVMLHEIEYEVNGNRTAHKSSLIVKGKNQLHTAMAQTVGLPLGIAAKLILQNRIRLTGLHIPVLKEIYEPVLDELVLSGITFNEDEKILD